MGRDNRPHIHGPDALHTPDGMEISERDCLPIHGDDIPSGFKWYETFPIKLYSRGGNLQYSQDVRGYLKRVLKGASAIGVDIATAIVKGNHPLSMRGIPCSDEPISIIAQVVSNGQPLSREDLWKDTTITDTFGAPGFSTVFEVGKFDSYGVYSRRTMKMCPPIDGRSGEIASIKRYFFEWEQEMIETLQRGDITRHVPTLDANEEHVIKTHSLDAVILKELISTAIAHVTQARQKGKEKFVEEVQYHTRRILEALAEWAAALGQLHSAGVLHVDSKPGNVLVQNSFLDRDTYSFLSRPFDVKPYATLTDFASSIEIDNLSAHRFIADPDMLYGVTAPFVAIEDHEELMCRPEVKHDLKAICMTLLYFLTGVQEGKSEIDYTIPHLTFQYPGGNFFFFSYRNAMQYIFNMKEAHPECEELIMLAYRLLCRSNLTGGEMSRVLLDAANNTENLGLDALFEPYAHETNTVKVYRGFDIQQMK